MRKHKIAVFVLHYEVLARAIVQVPFHVPIVQVLYAYLGYISLVWMILSCSIS